MAPRSRRPCGPEWAKLYRYRCMAADCLGSTCERATQRIPRHLLAILIWCGWRASRAVCCAGKDVELAASDGGASRRASYYPMKAMPGKWESLFVWCLSWFLSFWILVRPLIVSAFRRFLTASCIIYTRFINCISTAASPGPHSHRQVHHSPAQGRGRAVSIHHLIRPENRLPRLRPPPATAAVWAIAE